MRYRALDTIVVDRDLPEYGLRRGDLGAVVEVYEPDGLEVEFVTASGRTAALVTLNAHDVRPVAEDDLVAVRTCRYGIQSSGGSLPVPHELDVPLPRGRPPGARPRHGHRALPVPRPHPQLLIRHPRLDLQP